MSLDNDKQVSEEVKVPQTQSQTDHINNIQQAINSGDIEQLRHLALKGFVNNELRKQAWPILLGCMIENDKNTKNKNDKNQTKDKDDDKENSNNNNSNSTDHDNEHTQHTEHTYADQIQKDTDRSFGHFDVTKQYSSSERIHEQQVLQRMLNAVFYYNPDLHYTQGFHDMCSVFYIVCGEKLGTVLSENLAKRHMRDLARDNLHVFQFVLDLILPLLSLCDPQVYKFLSEADVTAFFALSWILTWFAHNISNFDDIVRIYDYFLSSHPIKPLYMTVTLILHCREELLLLTDVDQGRIHTFFQEFKWDINYDLVIPKCEQIYAKYPPQTLYSNFLTKQQLATVPNDSPFLAQNVSEIENLKQNYFWSTHYGSQEIEDEEENVWNYKHPKFWSHVLLPVSVSVVCGYLYLNHR